MHESKWLKEHSITGGGVSLSLSAVHYALHDRRAEGVDDPHSADISHIETYGVGVRTLIAEMHIWSRFRPGASVWAVVIVLLGEAIISGVTLAVPLRHRSRDHLAHARAACEHCEREERQRVSNWAPPTDGRSATA